MLIGAEVAKTPAGVRGWGDPAGALAPRRLPGTPAESEATGVEIKQASLTKPQKYIRRALNKNSASLPFIGHL
jgi:hypothetical protein